MYDYFVAELRCSRCGAVNAVTAYTNMQTHLRSDADGSALAVGYEFDPVDLTTKHILDSGYALISAPAEAAPIRLLDVWICPTCKTEQWATIDIANRRIVRIEAAPMSRATLESANYISEVNAELLAVSLMGISWAEFSERKLSAVDVLRHRL